MSEPRSLKQTIVTELANDWPVAAMFGLILAMFGLPLLAAALMTYVDGQTAEACISAGMQWLDGDCKPL